MSKTQAYCNLAKEYLATLKWLPPLLARLSLGSIFALSGWGKLHNLPNVVQFFNELGIPYPELQAPFVAGVELVCGAMLLLGLLTRVAAVPLIGTMAVALITAKKEDITSFTDLIAIEEYIYIVIFIWLMIEGPGKVSVDHFCQKKCKKS